MDLKLNVYDDLRIAFAEAVRCFGFSDTFPLHVAIKQCEMYYPYGHLTPDGKGYIDTYYQIRQSFGAMFDGGFPV